MKRPTNKIQGKIQNRLFQVLHTTKSCLLSYTSNDFRRRNLKRLLMESKKIKKKNEQRILIHISKSKNEKYRFLRNIDVIGSICSKCYTLKPSICW